LFLLESFLPGKYKIWGVNNHRWGTSGATLKFQAAEISTVGSLSVEKLQLVVAKRL